MPSGRIQQRIDPALQKEAEKILIAQGIRPSQAIILFYTEVKRFGGLPFQPTPVAKKEILKAQVRKGIMEARHGKGVQTFRSKKALFDSLKRL